LPFYSPQVDHVYGLHSSVELRRMARKRLATGRIPVKFLVKFLPQFAEEELPLTDASIEIPTKTEGR
jgi:hypothetical protein